MKADLTHAGARVTVRDNGLGFGVAGGTSTGTGLANLKARLKAVSGQAAKLEIHETPGGGVTITLHLPTGK